MSSESSQNTESSRYSRAAEQALASMNGTATDERRKRNDAIVNRDPSSPVHGRGRQADIDGILGAFAGGPDQGGSDDAQQGESDRGSDTPPERKSVGDREAGRDASPADRPALDLEDEEDPFEEKEKRKPRRKSLAAYLEENGLKADKVMDMEIAFDRRGDDDIPPATIGELKEVYRNSRQLTRDRDTFEDYREGVQNELIQGRQQMDVTIGMLRQTFGDDVMNEVFTGADKHLRANAAAGKRQLAEWFPEWDDAQVKDKDRGATLAMLKSYGFSEVEFERVLDPRLIRFAVHAMRLRARYDRAKAAWTEREKQPSKEGPSRKGNRPNATETAERLAKAGDKIGAVASLFGA